MSTPERHKNEHHTGTSSPKVLKYPIRRNDLANVYKLDREVIKLWLYDLGITHEKTLSPRELVRFIEHYGWPRPDVIANIPGVIMKMKQMDLFAA